MLATVRQFSLNQSPSRSYRVSPLIELHETLGIRYVLHIVWELGF
jgi:hypothetical protein